MPGAAVSCDANQARIKGTLAGTDIDLTWPTRVIADPFADEHRIAIELGQGGLLDISATDGQGTADLVFPADSVDMPATVVCVGLIKLNREPNSSRFTFTLDQLGVLGACPGAPVTGSLDTCF